MSQRKKQRKRKLHVTRLITCLSIMLFLSAGTLYTIHSYNQPGLYGCWESEETKKVIEFKNNGQIILKDCDETAEFLLLSNNKMSYMIHDKLFEMYIKLEGRQLSWGMDESQAETFRRVWN